jgi:F5/8 type C domain
VVCLAKISHASAGGEPASYNTRAYIIQTSANGSSWTTRATVTNNTAGLTTNTVSGVSARYVRLNITTPTQGTDPAARIYELKVFA